MDLYSLGTTRHPARLPRGPRHRPGLRHVLFGADRRARSRASRPGNGSTRRAPWPRPRSVPEASSQDLPLFGIPVGVKDIIDTRGIPTRMGSRIFADQVPTHSAWMVRRLEALGGLVMGKTVTTEFAYRAARARPAIRGTPPTRRADRRAARRRLWRPGFVPIAIGTQTLGSVIRPAAFCGVVGYKPTFGAISRTGIHPFSADPGYGRRLRAPRGGRRMVRRLPDGRRIRATRRPRCAPRRETLHVPLEPLAATPRLAVVRTPKWPLATEAQRTASRRTSRQLEAAGAQVREVNLPRALRRRVGECDGDPAHEAVKSFASIESRHRIRLSPHLIDTARSRPSHHARAVREGADPPRGIPPLARRPFRTDTTRS